MSVEQAYHYLFIGVLIYLALLITAGLIRAVIGPLITDRVLSINMIGTLVIGCIAVLSVMLNESYLVDVALIYAMISFLSVLILVSVYLPHRMLREAFALKEDGQAADKEPAVKATVKATAKADKKTGRKTNKKKN